MVFHPSHHPQLPTPFHRIRAVIGIMHSLKGWPEHAIVKTSAGHIQASAFFWVQRCCGTCQRGVLNQSCCAGGVQTGHGAHLAELLAPPVLEREQQEKVVVSGTVRAVGPVRVRPEEAERDLAGGSISAQAPKDGQHSIGKDGTKAGSAGTAGNPAAGAAAAQQHRHEQVSREGSIAGSAGLLNERHVSTSTQPQEEASAAETEVAASPVKHADMPAAVCAAAAAPGTSVLPQSSQNHPGPQPFPLQPARVFAANTAMKERGKLYCAHTMHCWMLSAGCSIGAIRLTWHDSQVRCA